MILASNSLFFLYIPSLLNDHQETIYLLKQYVVSQFVCLCVRGAATSNKDRIYTNIYILHNYIHAEKKRWNLEQEDRNVQWKVDYLNFVREAFWYGIRMNTGIHDLIFSVWFIINITDLHNRLHFKILWSLLYCPIKTKIH